MLYYKPEAPTGVSDDSTKRLATSIYVTFTETPVADWNGGIVNEYELYRMGSDDAYVYMASSATAYFDLKRYISACTTYNFTVTAMNGYGESDYSGHYSINNAGPPSKMADTIARSRDQSGFSVLATWGSATYDDGGCTLEGIGYWEYKSANTTKPYCYVNHEAYDATAKAASTAVPAVVSVGYTVADYCNFNVTDANMEASIYIAQYNQYTFSTDLASAFASNTPSDALGTVYYIDYPVGGGG